MTSGSWRKRGAQRGRERGRVHFDFALIDEALFVAVQIFDRVFDGDDVLGAQRIDAVNHGGERGGFTGTGGAGGQDQAALLFADLREDARQLEFFDGANFRRNHAQNHADVAALLEDVDAEAAQAGDAVGHIQLGRFLELLLLPVGHHAERHGKHFFRRDAGDVGEAVQQAVDAKIRVVADFQVQVGGAAFDGAAQEIVNIDGHSENTPRLRSCKPKLACVLVPQQGGWAGEFLGAQRDRNKAQAGGVERLRTPRPGDADLRRAAGREGTCGHRGRPRARRREAGRPSRRRDSASGWCARAGPNARAGFIAAPVKGPPKSMSMVIVRPMAKPAILLNAPLASTAVAKTTKTRKNVNGFERHAVQRG